MNIVDKIKALHQKEVEASENIQDLIKNLNDKEWSVVLHAHYEPARISVWRKGGNSNYCMAFVIDRDEVRVITAGMWCSDDVDLFKIKLNKWIAEY